MLFVLGLQGFLMAVLGEYLQRIQRDVDGQTDLLHRPGAGVAAVSGAQRILVTGGAGFISSNMIRYLLGDTEHEVVTMDALTYAGNLANLDDVIDHDRLRFIKGDIRDVARRHRGAGRRRRDRQRGRRVARVQVDRGRRRGVRHHQRRRHPGAAGRDARAPGRALHPDLLVRGVRHRRVGADDGGSPAQPALAVRRHQGGRRPAGLLVLVHVRPAGHDHPPVQQLRAVPASREGDPAVHHPGAHRPAADDPRRRRRSRDWLHVFDTAEAITRACEVPRREHRRPDDQRRHRDRRVGRADRGHDPRLAGQARQPQAPHRRPAGPGRPHIGSTDRAAKLLGWRSSISFEDGLDRTIAWYRDNPAWWTAVLAGEKTAQTV